MSLQTLRRSLQMFTFTPLCEHARGLRPKISDSTLYFLSF